MKSFKSYHIYKNSLFLIFLSLAFNVDAQSLSDSTLKNNLFKVGVKPIGSFISYEKKISNVATINAEFNVTRNFISYGVISYTSDFSNPTFESNVMAFWTPEIDLEGRRYVGFKRRQEKKRRIVNNSFDFLSLAVNYGFAPSFNNRELEPGSKFAIGAFWGLQRNVLKVFSLDLQLGVKYTEWSKAGTFIDPDAKIKFGYIINRSK